MLGFLLELPVIYWQSIQMLVNEPQLSRHMRRAHSQHIEEYQNSLSGKKSGEMVRKVRLECKSWHGEWYETSFVINLTTGRFEYPTESSLLRNESHGSAALGYIVLLILLFPLTLLLLPYVGLRQAPYRWMERKHGMSAHGVLVLQKLKGQLDVENEALIAEAYRKEYAWEKKYHRHVSREEALRILSESESVKYITIYSKSVNRDEEKIFTRYMWIDESGEAIATYEPHQFRPTFRVLGSLFSESENLEELVNTYKSRRQITSTDKETSNPAT